MKNEKIVEVIEAANGRGAIHIFQHVRIGNITFAKVVFPPLDDEASDLRSADFFLIFEGESKCVGAVYDMGEGELHVYVQPEYRRRRLMTAALKDVVLPYLFYRGRTKQIVTFSDEGVGRMNEKVGFRRVGEGEAVACADDFPAFDPSRCTDLPIAEERTTALQNQVVAVADDLRWIRRWIAPGPHDYVPQKVERLLHAIEELASLMCRQIAVSEYTDRLRYIAVDASLECSKPPLASKDFQSAVRGRLKNAAINLFWVEVEIGPRFGNHFERVIGNARSEILDLADHPQIASIRHLSIEGPAG